MIILRNGLGKFVRFTEIVSLEIEAKMILSTLDNKDPENYLRLSECLNLFSIMKSKITGEKKGRPLEIK